MAKSHAPASLLIALLVTGCTSRQEEPIVPKSIATHHSSPTAVENPLTKWYLLASVDNDRVGNSMDYGLFIFKFETPSCTFDTQLFAADKSLDPGQTSEFSFGRTNPDIVKIKPYKDDSIKIRCTSDFEQGYEDRQFSRNYSASFNPLPNHEKGISISAQGLNADPALTRYMAFEVITGSGPGGGTILKHLSIAGKHIGFVIRNMNAFQPYPFVRLVLRDKNNNPIDVSFDMVEWSKQKIEVGKASDDMTLEIKTQSGQDTQIEVWSLP